MNKILPLICALVLLLWGKTSVAQCEASFTTSIDSNTNRVTFIYVDTNSHITHTWRIDQFVTNEALKSYVLPNAGSYTITHSVYDSTDQCRDSFSNRIRIIKTLPCYANFAVTELKDGKVTFNNLGLGLNFKWIFGDGQSSANQQPTHQYTENKEYTACMIAQNNSESCSDTLCKMVLIQTADTTGCDAAFSETSLDRTRVSFEAEIKTYQSYFWDFGDNTTGTGSSVIHQYKDSGIYTTCLTIFNERLNCLDTVCKTVTISPPVRCIADFTVIMGEKDSIYVVPDRADYDRYIWDFGTGDSSTSIFANHQYLKSGTYEVCLTVFDSANNCTEKACKTINIRPKGDCKVAFNVGLDTSINNVIFLINRSSNFAGHQYSWTFGDGGKSNLRNPSHTFHAHQAYEVCLEITNNNLGCEDRYCDSLGLDENGKLLKNGAFELIVIDFEELSVDQESKLDGNVYPNPATKSCTVQLNTDAESELEITSISGKRQWLSKQKVKSFEVEVSNWPKGMYILRLIQENKVMTKKIIVQ